MIEPWMRADPLLSLLIDRAKGDPGGTERAFETVERIAVLTADGTDELAAIEAVMRYVPHAERERIAMEERR